MRHPKSAYTVTFVPPGLIQHGPVAIHESGPSDVREIITTVQGASGDSGHRFTVVRHGNTAIVTLDVGSAKEWGLSPRWMNTTWGIHCIVIRFIPGQQNCGETFKYKYLNNN